MVGKLLAGVRSLFKRQSEEEKAVKREEKRKSKEFRNKLFSMWNCDHDEALSQKMKAGIDK